MRFRPSTEPPRLAALLLALLTPAADRRYLLSDLQEDYDAWVEADGTEAARRRYWRQVRDSLPPLLRQRLCRRRRAPGVSAAWRPSAAVPTTSANRGITMFDLLRDLRLSARGLARKPHVMAVTILSLALGIGVVTLAFSVADAFILRSLGGDAPDDLLAVYQSEDDGDLHGRFSFPDYVDFSENIRAVDSSAAYRLGLVNYAPDGAAPSSQLVQLVTGDYFRVSGETPALGRGFLPQETRMGQAERVVVLSHDFWDRHLGADPSVLGSAVQLDGHPFTVVGVARDGVVSGTLGLEVAAYLPLGIPGGTYRATEDELVDRNDREYVVMARLADGAGLAQVGAQLDALSTELHARHQEAWTDDRGQPRRLTALPQREAALVGDMGAGTAALAGLCLLIGAAILALACSNAASLFLARAHERRREMALRLAIGSSRRRLLFLLLVESLVPALVAGLLGFLVARVAVGAIDTVSLPIGAELTFAFDVNLRAFGVSLALAVITSVLFGLAPALEGARTDLVSGLKSSVEGRPGRFALRRVLVVGQIAASLVFLLGASLGLRGVLAAERFDVGFTVDSGAVMSRVLRPARLSGDALTAYLDAERRRLLELPEISEVHWTSTAELTFLADIDPVAVDAGDGAERVEVARNAVTPGYLASRGIAIQQGRALRATDTAGAPAVAVVNAAFARRFWPGESAVGQTFSALARDSQGAAPAGQVLEVVGVVPDGRYVDHDSADRPFLWVPLAQSLDWRLLLHVQGPVSPQALVRVLEKEVTLFADEVAMVAPSTYGQMIDVRLAGPRMASKILAGSGLFGLVLATLGVYGLLSFIAVLRRREMAIRQAIGAGRRQVVVELLREGLRLAGWGLALGLAAGLGLAHLARGALFGVSPLDPVAVGASCLLLLTAAVLAGLLPARRLASDSPIDRLRAN